MAMVDIQSADNGRIKALRALKERKFRRQEGLLLAEGDHLVGEAIQSGQDVRSLVISREKVADYGGYLRWAQAQDVEVLLCPPRILQSLGDARSSQGVLAAVAWREAAWPDFPDTALALALDGVQDPGNVGALIRTADAVGAACVLLGPGCADPTGPKAVRASMGSLFHLPLVDCPDLQDALRALVGQGWAVLSGDLAGENFLTRRVVQTRQVLLIGNEGGGVSQDVSEAATHRLRLPMAGQAESFNAGISAGIMLYDMARSLSILQ